MRKLREKLLSSFNNLSPDQIELRKRVIRNADETRDIPMTHIMALEALKYNEGQPRAIIALNIIEEANINERLEYQAWQEVNQSSPMEVYIRQKVRSSDHVDRLSEDQIEALEKDLRKILQSSNTDHPNWEDKAARNANKPPEGPTIH